MTLAVASTDQNTSLFFFFAVYHSQLLGPEDVVGHDNSSFTGTIFVLSQEN